MTPRALSFVAVALLCAAVGASATYTQWSMTTDAQDDFRVLRTENGVYFSLELVSAKLTAKEAASLGRALLEAAGQPEKACPNNSGLINIDPEPIRGIYKGTYQADPWILDGRQCRPIPCPEGRVGCLVSHMVCDEEKKP